MDIYEQIKIDIKQDYYQQNFSNDGQRFNAWYLRNIYQRDMNQTKDEITDGANDKQIDAVFIDDDNSKIIIIQGKFIGGNTVNSEPLREVLSSWVQIKDLARLQEVGNEKLKRKLSEIAAALDDEYEISFELVTTAKLTNSARQDLATFQKNLVSIGDGNDGVVATINLVDREELERRYSYALEVDNPVINHEVALEDGKYLYTDIAGTKIIIAAVPLKECIKIPGINDGTLFQKNVRQSLGLNNAVNRGIAKTIQGNDSKDFFFFHNGITAICNNLELNSNKLKLKGLSIVNGCQSLTTILSNSEKVKTLDGTYVMFRFYEIPQRDRADKISTFTNSQSSVKPRDLKSNDKRVLNLKKLFEQKYPQGYFITKRGEEAPADKDKIYCLDLSNLGKYMISWHSQRPNIAYSETKIFDKYFEQLFKRTYLPENAEALNLWMQEIMKVWTQKNPLHLNESLLAMKSYAPFHQLYGVSMCFSIMNNNPDKVPIPDRCYIKANSNGLLERIVVIAGVCLNSALTTAAHRQQPQNRVFSPQNWIKSKTSLDDINFAISNYFNMLPTMEGGDKLLEKLKETLILNEDAFEDRWAAD